MSAILGYKIVNLRDLIDERGEERTRELLSSFVCPHNADVENFLRHKAIQFAIQSWSQTHLVYASYKERPELAGYFTLAVKSICVKASKLTSNLRHRINQFATYDKSLRTYTLAAPLIAQLGRNFNPDFPKLITGDELLKMACMKVSDVQRVSGGKFTYLECENDPWLLNFYESNNFKIFDYRELDRDETDLKGTRLVQLIKYL
jgi:hypothetical protein